MINLLIIKIFCLTCICTKSFLFFRPSKDIDLIAREKAYQFADKLAVLQGQSSVDVCLNASAKEALVSASAQALTYRQPVTDDEEKNRKKEKRREKERELNLRMPYQVPEPIQRSDETLKEDTSLSKFVPMSDYKWYKKVQEANEFFQPSNISIEQRRSYRIKRHLVPDVAYVIPDKRLGTTML